MEETHVYTVAPRRPIRGLIKGKIIIKPMNLSLTKDEVLMCMKHGPVYRKFYLDGSERVTPSNLDRLHRKEHLTEEQYEELCKKQAAKEKTIPEADTTEEAPIIEEEPVVEEEQVEEAVEEPKKEEEEQSFTEDSSEPIVADLLSNPIDVAPKKTSSKSRKKKKSAAKAKALEEGTPEETISEE